VAKRSKASPAKTNACRVLDALRVAYELRPYTFDPEDLAAERVAEKVGLPVQQVYKTLCLRAHDGAIYLAVLPGDRKVNLKAAARLAGVRSLEPVAVRELPQLTGYVRGGVTALACKKPYPVLADARIGDVPVISVSAGQRGLQIFVAPKDYLAATGATVGEIAD